VIESAKTAGMLIVVVVVGMVELIFKLIGLAVILLGLVCFVIGIVHGPFWPSLAGAVVLIALGAFILLGFGDDED